MTGGTVAVRLALDHLLDVDLRGSKGILPNRGLCGNYSYLRKT